MRLERIRLHSFGVFGDVDLDLSKVEGRVVALVGANGAGKSSLLEMALPGIMYRDTPTRGTLKSLATARDSWIEAVVVNGARWTIRHEVDAASGKGESSVLDAAGTPTLAAAQNREFDRWSAEHLPPPEVLFATVFQPQQAEGFIKARPGERKAILLRVLGLERLEVLAERARKRAGEARAALDVLVARIADERTRGGDLEELQGALGRALAAHQARVEERGARAEDARLAEEAFARAAEAWRAEQERRRRRGDVEAERTAADKRLEELAARVANNRAVLDDRELILASVERDRALAAELETVKAAAGQERAAAAVVTERLGALVARRRMTVETSGAALERLEAKRAAAAGRAEAEAVAARLPGLEAGVAQATAEEQAAQQDLERVTEETVGSGQDRIAGLRTGLAGVRAAEDLAGAQAVAGRALETDDALGAAPSRLAAARRAADAATEARKAAERALAPAQAAVARLQAIATAERDAVEAEAVVKASTAEMAEASIAEGAAVQARDAKLAEAATLEGRARELAKERSELAPYTAKADPLTRAEARLAELAPQEAAARAELATIEDRLAALGAPADGHPPADDAVNAAREALNLAASAESAAKLQVALTEQTLERCRAAATRVEELETERAAVATDLADWNRLAEDLGKDGLQALEIDAAGPEMTALVNDLLRSCLGTRYTASVETTRISADGKKLLEGCEIRVIDSERGRDAEASTYSGGEQSLLGEALSLALTMLACRRAGVQDVTLVRDESSAALDTANAPAYIAMLRRAAEIVGASHVLFVSHDRAVQELADVRLLVHDGIVEVA